MGKVDFAPVRWWQVVDFIRLSFAVVQGHDPWADRILSQPWAPSSLLEYAYILIKLPIADAHFIVVSGERAGTVWTITRSGLQYVVGLGLLPRFQTSGIGTQVVRFLERNGLESGCSAGAARTAASNKPIHHLVTARGGGPLGLATTRLTLSNASFSQSSSEMEVRDVNKAEATRAWRRWKLRAVEQVSGRSGADVAVKLLDAFWWLASLPRGDYTILYKGEREIGFAAARRQEGASDLSIFPSPEFWTGPQTGSLVEGLASHVGYPIRHLTLAQQHAETLAASAPFDFERDREQERRFLSWPIPYGGESSRKVFENAPSPRLGGVEGEIDHNSRPEACTEFSRSDGAPSTFRESSREKGGPA